MIKKLKLLSLLLFPLSIFINTVLSRYPHFIEKYYSISINKFIVEILSNISGRSEERRVGKECRL